MDPDLNEFEPSSVEPRDSGMLSKPAQNTSTNPGPANFKAANPSWIVVVKYVQFNISATLLKLATISLSPCVMSSWSAKLINRGFNRYQPEGRTQDDREAIKDYIEGYGGVAV